MGNQIIFGSSVVENFPPEISKAVVSFPGCTPHGQKSFEIDENLMSKHILLLGGSGCGKTNSFLYFLEMLRENMTDDDIVIIFDTKGEFYDGFSKDGDYVIGNSARFRKISNTWNIFEEVLADGWDDSNISMNSREIASALFRDRGSSTQPFFCNAARDIFRGIVLDLVRGVRSGIRDKKVLNNAFLLKVFREFTANHYRMVFQSHSDLRSLVQYFGNGESNQALGVFAELASMLSDYFEGILAEHDPEKSISIRKVVRDRGKKAIFVEYDLSVGETLAPIYRLLVDQALKEALSRTKKRGNVYLIADEFKLLPKLQHIDDALNFGRGLGVKVMAGIQSIDQLYDVYGKDKGSVIAGGFGSIFAFHTNDESSRSYISKRFGTNISLYDYTDSYRNSTMIREREGFTVEEWDQLELGVGQAVIGLGYEKPFLFQFDEYER